MMYHANMKVAIIGGGAAGFFSAINVKENFPKATVSIFEKSNKFLAKVKVSGGGRCNVTNACDNIADLSKAYPRGEKMLKKAFYSFNNMDMIKWLESRAVALVTQDDGCVFPKSQNSQTIIDCFYSEAQRLGISKNLGMALSEISKSEDQLELLFANGEKHSFDKVIIATGGSPKRSGLRWLEDLNHLIEEPLPSLFTFNMPGESIRELMGIVVEQTRVSIQGTKLKSDGPLLITHWGMSGPAILKLSAFGARILADKDYKFTIQVNWVNQANHDKIKEELIQISYDHSNKILANYRPYNLPDRLWKYFLDKGKLSPQKKWNELGNKGINTLVRLVGNDEYQVNGKTTFKEEFVTSGGISLKSIDHKTMESKAVKNLYFTGELLDIDGITGGYNFQAAWTTAFIAAKLNSK